MSGVWRQTGGGGAVLCLLDLDFSVPLNSPQLLPVVTSESPLLLLKDGLGVFCYPRLVIWGTAPCWDSTVHTEVCLIRAGLSEPFNDLSVRLTECTPSHSPQNRPAVSHRPPLIISSLTLWLKAASFSPEAHSRGWDALSCDLISPEERGTLDLHPAGPGSFPLWFVGDVLGEFGVLSMQTWLKSPEIIMRAFRCLVCSPAMAVWQSHVGVCIVLVVTPKVCIPKPHCVLMSFHWWNLVKS